MSASVDTIHVRKGKSGKWYYRIENENKQILSTSQTYKGGRAEAVERAEAVKKRHPEYELLIDPA
ncbi:MAG: hypothetical protein ACXABY_07815 [Candidatus Thorarchaeota archaeon]|jgi:uncharacterized protein YegP (UPF0339 family)